MTNSNAKGGFFGKALAAACSLALVASLTPAAAVSAFAAGTQEAPEMLTVTIQQLGSDGNVAKSATTRLNNDRAYEYMASSSSASVIYNAGNRFGVATVTSSSAATVTDLVSNVEGKSGVKLIDQVVLGGSTKVKDALESATVKIESGYTADADTLKNTGVITDFVQSVEMDWNELEISKNWYPNTTKDEIVTTDVKSDAGALIVTSGHTVFNEISTQQNTNSGIASDTAKFNQTKEQVDTALRNNNGFTFITGITENNAQNYDFSATAKMVQGVSKITVTIPYPGLENTARVAGTNWDDTMIDTIDAMNDSSSAPYKALGAKGIIPQPSSWEPGVFVVATAGGYEDALAASGFAGLMNAPLLMTDRNELTANTKKYITDAAANTQGYKTIYLIGGNMAVSDEVQAELEAIKGVANTTMGSVVRIAGENSWDTALEIYKRGIELGKVWGDRNGDGTSESKEVIVATSLGFQDALSISPYAYSEKLPVILTNGDAVLSDKVAEAMQAAIKNAKATTAKDKKVGEIEQATIVGGTVVVSPVVNNQLLKIDINRLAGKTAYDTSNDIAEFLYKEVDNFKNKTLATMATGELYLDALSSCNFTGINHTVLLLVNDEAENGTVAITDFLTDNGPQGVHPGKIAKAVIFGGTAVVSEATEILADATLKSID